MNTTLIIAAGVAVLVVAIVLFALNRSWGNFPSRIGMPPTGTSAPGASRPLEPAAYGMEPAEPAESDRWDSQQNAANVPASPQAPVLIEHPLIRRAAESALAKGGDASRYIFRNGDQLYFSFDQISDPVQRQTAYDMMRRLQAGEDVDTGAAFTLIRQLFMR